MDELNQLLPTHWSHSNPIDVLGDADPNRYAKACEIALKNPDSDGLLAILTPQAMTDPIQTAKQFVERLQGSTLPAKPILASWMGGAEVAGGEAMLNEARIFTLPFPDTAARVFNYMWRYAYNLRGIYETPVLEGRADEKAPDHAQAEEIIQSIRASGRTLLSEFESKQLLKAYGIPTVETHIAQSEAEAVQLAQEMGYPVVLKLYSETITHKTDVGGVKLNLADADDVRKAYQAIESAVLLKAGAEHFLGVTVQPMLKLEGYELILGSSPDPQFGPVLLFGTGGQLVEVFKDRALGLPPLNTTLARRMMEQTKIYTALKGVRGRPPVDLAVLEQLLVQFSQLVVEQRWIKEIDINPLLASPDGFIALDARVVLHSLDVEEDKLPQAAIRPYPMQYVSDWTMKNGTPIKIRPIRPEDEPLVVKFHENLSEESIYSRYFHLIKLQTRVAHERLSRICFIDYDRELALVADYKDPATGEHQVLGFGRLSKLHGRDEAEFSMLIGDRFQCKGLGTELLRRLLEIGQDEKLQYITAEILSENRAMQHVCQKLGFHLESTSEPSIMKVVYKLR
jgi:acetyltransferase